MLKKIVSALVLSIISTSAWCQVKVSTITNESTPSSKVVMTNLRSKFSSHPNLFTLVSNKDSDRGLVITTDCIPQERKTDTFVCFYTSHYAGGTSKTFMGGGIYLAATADQMADTWSDGTNDPRERN